MSGGGIEALKGASFFLPMIENGTKVYPQTESNDLTVSVDRATVGSTGSACARTLSTVSSARRGEYSLGSTIKVVYLSISSTSMRVPWLFLHQF